MKKTRNLILLAALTGLASCEKPIISEEPEPAQPAKPKTTLAVLTRADGDVGEISYPMNIYIFQGEKCMGTQTLTGKEQDMNFTLSAGSYSVYAVGGASAADYSLPSKDNAKPTSELALKSGGG